MQTFTLPPSWWNKHRYLPGLLPPRIISPIGKTIKRPISKNGIMKTKLKVDYRRSTVDVRPVRSYTELIVTSPTPHITATQIHHNLGDMAMTENRHRRGRKPGVGLLTPSHGPVCRGSRLERTGSRETGKPENAPGYDRYLSRCVEKLLGKPDHSLQVPSARVSRVHDTPACSGSCTRGGFPANSTRRYVIDEELGAVNVLCTFTSVGEIPYSYELRLEAGKIRYVNIIAVRLG